MNDILLQYWYNPNNLFLLQTPIIPELFALSNDIEMFDGIMKEGHMQEGQKLETKVMDPDILALT